MTFKNCVESFVDDADAQLLAVEKTLNAQIDSGKSRFGANLALINAWSTHGNLDRVVQYVAAVAARQQQGGGVESSTGALSLDVRLFNALILMHLRAGDSSSAFRLLVERGSVLTRRTLNSLLLHVSSVQFTETNSNVLLAMFRTRSTSSSLHTHYELLNQLLARFKHSNRAPNANTIFSICKAIFEVRCEWQKVLLHIFCL